MAANKKTMLDYALENARQGFPVFPCFGIVDKQCECKKGKDCGRQSGKHPRITKWQDAATTNETQIREWWRMWPNSNPAIATGHEFPHPIGEYKCTAGIDIDIAGIKVGQQSLDVLEAKHGKLPPTLQVETGSGGMHYYYLTRCPVTNVKADDPNRVYPLGMNIDVRGWHGYVIAHGSRHFSGWTYAFLNALSVAPMPAWMEALLPHNKESSTPLSAPAPATSPMPDIELMDAATQAAMEALDYKDPTEEELQEALKMIPAELITGYDAGAMQPGCWWEVGVALKNMLADKGFTIWKEFSRRDPAFDTKYSKKISEWESSLERQWNNFRASKHSYGTIFFYAKKNKKYRTPERFLQAIQQQKIEKADQDGVMINAPDNELTGRISQRLQQIRDESESPILYRFGDRIARPELVPHSKSRELEPRVKTLLKETSVLQALNHNLRFFAINSKNIPVPANLAKHTAAHILECSPREFALPTIIGVTRAPVMLPNGTIHNQPGYSPETLLYHYPDVVLPEISEHPSKREIKTASGLLQEVFCDMPFADKSDMAHALALLMAPLLRSLIDGEVPGHFITKPVQATGATLLANAAIFLKTGIKETRPQNAPSDNAEWGKTILSALLPAPDFCFYDDCKSLVSPNLATVLTSSSYQGRKLTTNEMLIVPNRAIWMFLGNNPRISRDIRRRLIDIRLDAQMVDPENRPTEHFQHPNLIPWLSEARSSVIAAIFTLARAWMDSRPQQGKTLASFGAWSQVMGGILEVAGVEGFLDSPKDRLVDETETENSEFIYCLTGHRVKYDAVTNGKSFRRLKASRLLEMADKCGLEIVGDLKGTGVDPGRAKEFATQKLNSLKDRPFLICTDVKSLSEDGDDILAQNMRAAVTVKLSFFPSGGDSAWKLLFERPDSKLKDRWSEEIPAYFSHVKFGDIWKGFDWEAM